MCTETARSYANLADNFLAAASSACLTLLFLTSMLYKYQELTDEEDVRAKMSLKQRINYDTPLYLSAVAMVGSSSTSG